MSKVHVTSKNKLADKSLVNPISKTLPWHKGRDQDGRLCRFGTYHLSDDSREIAQTLIGG